MFGSLAQHYRRVADPKLRIHNGAIRNDVLPLLRMPVSRTRCALEHPEQ